MSEDREKLKRHYEELARKNPGGGVQTQSGRLSYREAAAHVAANDEVGRTLLEAEARKRRALGG